MKIAYITNCFGSQSHTFIRREISALRALDVELQLFGIRQDFENRAPDAEALIEETQYLYPLSVPQVLLDTLVQFSKHPFYWLAGAFAALTEDEITFKRKLKMFYHYVVSIKHAKALKSNHVTHIHAHFMNASASVAMYAAYHARIPYSITVHSAGTYGTPHIIGALQKLKQAQMLFMISNYNVEYFHKIFPCKDKSHVVRCGMNLEDFPFSAPKEASTSSPLSILAVGRFVEKKGFKYLIQACQELKNAGIRFKLTLIGDGPLSHDLKSLSIELELGNEVHFAGKCSTEHVRSAMQLSTVVVVPSVTSTSGEMEGLPVVIMEAMALGKPIIATRHSGIPEIVIDGKTGTLVDEKDPSGLAKAIIEVNNLKDNSKVFSAKTLLDKEFDIQKVATKRKQLFIKMHQE